MQRGPEPADGAGPVQRETAGPVHRRPRLFDQVANEPHAAGRQVYQQVVVGVAATQVQQLRQGAAEIEGHLLADQHRGWRDDDLAPLVHRLLARCDQFGEHRPLVGVEVRGHPFVPVDRRAQIAGRAEPRVAEAVVEVCVRVHHPADRQGAQFPQVGADLVGLAVRGAGVADEQPAGAAHHADAHVVGLVPAPEDAVRHLFPGCHAVEANGAAGRRGVPGGRSPGPALAAGQRGPGGRPPGLALGAASRTTPRCPPRPAPRSAVPWRRG